METTRFEPFARSRVLVTGGAGFVGSNIVRKLVETGARITVLDDFYTGQRSNIVPSDNITVVEGSVTDIKLVDKLVAQTDYIIHEAARNIIVSTRNPREDFEVNIGGTLNLLMAMRENPVKRMVYASSASVYGNPRHLPINEDESTSMLSPYAVSKYSGENYCKAFYESYALSVAVVRYSNVYGPGQRPDNPYCGVIGKFFNSVLDGQAPNIHGDGEQTRDFTYIDDVVDATLLAAVSPKAEGQVYNVGTGREVSVNQLAGLIIKLSGHTFEPTYIDRRDIDNIRRRSVNIEKIRRELRWLPSFTLERGLKATFEWFQQSPDLVVSAAG